ncbi:MAG: sulfatase-like hydrolase/transferase [Myxococcota bacterium]
MARPRNIVVLVADSLRYDSVHAGDSGLPYATKHGARFTQARSAGCWTLPGTASLFTGLMPHEHGADAQSRKVRKDVPMLAGVLHEHGYQTHQITANIATTEIFGLDRGYDEMVRIWQHVPSQYKKVHEVLILVGKPRLRKKILSPDFIAGQLAEDLEASKVWLQNTAEDIFDRARKALADDTAKGRPSFLFLNLMETHFPYHVGPLFETTAPGPLGKMREVVALFHTINQTWLTTGRQPIAPDMMRRLRGRQRLAWQRLAPRVDAFLREMHEAGNLVVFCADHGDCFGEQDWVYHFSNVSDGGNRVPLYWLHPDGHDAGRRIDVPVSSRDVFHALLSEVGDARARFHLVKEPERSFPVMQSAWYNNQGKTLDRFRFNQICFVESGARWAWRRGEWFTAPPATDAGEPPFQRLPPGFDPFAEGVFEKGRVPTLRKTFSEFSEYSARIGA